MNGVPLRRVNQAYVIATSTKVDVSSVSVPAHIDDSYFARVAADKKTKADEEEFFASNVFDSTVNKEWPRSARPTKRQLMLPFSKLSKRSYALPLPERQVLPQEGPGSPQHEVLNKSSFSVGNISLGSFLDKHKIN